MPKFQNLNLLASLFGAAVIATSVNAQTTVFTDGAGDSTWSSVANWSNGVPTGSSAVQIGTQPTDSLLGIDTGATSVASFTFNNTLTGPVEVLAFGADTLSVAGNIVNNSASNMSFSLVVSTTANAIFQGPLTFSNIVNVGTNQVTLANNTIFSGTKLNFDLTSTAVFGRFLGVGTATVTGVTIDIGGTYTGVVNDTFDLTSGNFSGATLGTLPTLTGGLSWNTSNFLTNGTLSVIPEPGTWILITTSLLAVVLFRRRKLA